MIPRRKVSLLRTGTTSIGVRNRRLRDLMVLDRMFDMPLGRRLRDGVWCWQAEPDGWTQSHGFLYISIMVDYQGDLPILSAAHSTLRVCFNNRSWVSRIHAVMSNIQRFQPFCIIFYLPPYLLHRPSPSSWPWSPFSSRSDPASSTPSPLP